MDRYECRRQLVSELEQKGYLVKKVPHDHNVGVCYRCGTTVEPLTSDQWFVRMKPLAEPAIKAVEDGSIKFIPERFSKNYFNWMNNILDWCISRQLWWGHRIPAFYCQSCGEMTVSKEDITVCPKCGGKVEQDSDVLDTWFSSALWPFETLGWPDDTEELRKYYPTSVLVTGYDIITFWVSRMIFSGLEHMGQKPFSTVFIHGLVRDAQGRKMSKSLGNGIDPLEIIKQYGADALRFALASGNSPGNDMRFSDEKIEAARNFANKLWNASRFVRMNLTVESVELPSSEKLALEDKWIIDKFNRLAANVTVALDKFEIGVALAQIYDFTWDIFCDWYIELVKPRLNDKDSDRGKICQNVLAYVLIGTLKLLHPFMPFITEEIYQSLPHEAGDPESIMISSYPEYSETCCFEQESEQFSRVIDAIKAIRTRRSEMNVPPSRKSKVFIQTKYKSSFSDNCYPFFVSLASASQVLVADEFSPDEVSADNAVQIITDSASIYLPLADIIDFEKEKARLETEKKKLLSEIDRLEKKLQNQGFVSKAPASVVQGEKAKLARYTENLDGVNSALEKLN